MTSKFNYLVQAVLARGFSVRIVSDYIIRINGKEFIKFEAIDIMRNIVKKYKVRQELSL